MTQRNIIAFPESAYFPKLYERSQHIANLQNHLTCAMSGSFRVVFLSGPPGIGKTVLADALRPFVQNINGFFASAKFDQFKKDVPYFAFSEAFGRIIRQILTQSEDAVDHWKNKLHAALEDHAKVIGDIVPEIELILGPAKAVAELPSAQTAVRLRHFLEKFLRLFAAPEHPLVLFLDDIHWGDRESMQLLEFLTEQGGIPHCLIIGTFRTTEMDKSFLERIGKHEQTTGFIELETLSEQSVCEWVNEKLQNPGQDLSSLLYKKTKGNPLFLQQMLKDIKPVLSGHDSSRPAAAGLTQDTRESLTDWILYRIRELSHDTLDVLKTASCIGNLFSMDTLDKILDKDRNELQMILDSAIAEDVIIRDQDQYKFFHDRIRETIYNMIDAETKKQIQAKIGRSVWRNSSAEKVDEVVFEIADRLNDAVTLITEKEKAELSLLNIRAGNKAKRNTAYGKALTYYQMSLQLMPDGHWNSHYGQSLEVHSGIMECRFMTGDETGCRTSFDNILRNVKSNLEKLRIHGILITIYGNAGKNIEAIEIGRRALQIVGLHFPTSKLSVLRQALKLQFLLFIRKSQLSNLEEMTDPEKLELMETLRTLSSPSFDTANLIVYSWVVLSMVNLSHQYGHAPQTSFAFALYGMFLAGQRKYQKGCDFGITALQLAAKHDNKQIRGGVSLIYGAFIGICHKPLRSTMPFLQRAEKDAAEAGDIQYMGFSRFQHATQKFMSGHHLHECIREAEWAMEFCKKIGHENSYLSMLSLSTPFYNLVGVNKLPANFSFLSIFNYKLSKILVSVILTEFSTACAEAESVESAIESFPGLLISETSFCYALALSAVYASSPGQAKSFRAMRKAQKFLEKIAQTCPENFLHKYLLVSAEIARIGKNKEKTMQLYDQAIQSAKENEFLHVEALANEFAARFYLSEKHEVIAKTYMTEAYKCYARWGATAKTKMMYEQYPSWLSDISTDVNDAKTGGIGHEDIVKRIASHYDLLSIMQMNTLLEKLIHLGIELSGAERLCLFIDFEGGRTLIAEASKNSDMIIETADIQQTEKAPTGMLNYVKHTLQPLVCDDAYTEKLFDQDKYIQLHRPKSVLCIPILKQGRFIGSLYLENNSILGAFTTERIEIIKLLSTQAAISIENAKIYEERRMAEERLRNLTRHLESVREEERTRIAREIHDDLGQALTLLKLENSNVVKKAETNDPTLNENILRINKMVDAITERVQQVATELRPPILDDFGLAAAMEWLIKEWKKQTTYKWSVRLQDVRVNEEQKTALFRVFQEALTNIVRHSHATAVSAYLSGDNNRVELRISDDGIGLSLDKLSDPASIGLTGMKERMLSCRGKLEIIGSNGSGTIVIAVIE